MRLTSDSEDTRETSRRSRSRSPPAKRKEEGILRGYAVYVSGISSRTSASEVERRFSKAGQVNGVQLVDDPRTKEFRGFAFVYYDLESDALEAARSLNGAELDGRFIQVARARRDRPRSPTPGEYLGNDRHSRASTTSSSSRDTYRSSDRDRERDRERDRRSPPRYDRDRRDDRGRDERRDDRGGRDDRERDRKDDRYDDRRR